MYKRQAVYNGIYNYTSNVVLTRSTDFDQPAEITGGDYVFVQAGSTQASSSWVEQGAVGNVGVGNINFVQFSASQSYSAGNALNLTGSQFNVQVDNGAIIINGSNQLTVGNVPGGNVKTDGSTIIVNGSDQLLVGTVPAANVSGLATVATSGNYNDLSNAYGNTDVASYLSAYSGNISTTGNVTGNYILGNGGQLTGFTSSQITTALGFTPGTGNGTVTNVQGNGTVSGLSLTGNVTTTGNLTLSGTLDLTGLSGNISTTGNITGNYILGNGSQLTGTYSNTNVSSFLASLGSNSISTSGNITTGNLSVTGNISGNIVAPGANTQVEFNDNGISNATAGLTFNKTTNALATTGTVSATANITGGNILTGGLISSTGNAIHGNILTGGLVSATANITGGNILTGGLISATSTITTASNLTVNGGVISTTASTANVFNVTPTTVNIGAGASTAVNIGNASGVVSLSGNVQGSTNGFAIGYLNIPQVSWAANATIGLSDAGKHYYTTSASNITLTIANSATANFAVGTAINFINAGTGTMSILQGSGVTMYLAGNATAGNRTVSSFGAGTIQKVDTNTWFLVGVGLT